MIVVFSGTGNSRYVADMLGKLLKDKVVDANYYIKEEKKAVLFSASPWIFVAPVYVSAPPLIFMEFLKKSEFSGSKAAYFINTCAGGMGASPYYNHLICEEKHFIDMGTNQVVMPQNYLIYFKTKEKKETMPILRKAEPVIRELADRIDRKAALDDPHMKKWEVLSTRLILDWYYKKFITARAFRSTESCIGCSKCAVVCPLNNISLIDGHPVWGDSCTHCMACINACPKAAIEYGRKTAGKPRYFCPKYGKEEQ